MSFEQVVSCDCCCTTLAAGRGRADLTDGVLGRGGRAWRADQRTATKGALIELRAGGAFLAQASHHQCEHCLSASWFFDGEPVPCVAGGRSPEGSPSDQSPQVPRDAQTGVRTTSKTTRSPHPESPSNDPV